MDSFTKDDQLCLACHFSIHRLQEYTKDDHLCIACLQTIHGLQNYVIHREINCPGRSDINKTGRKQTQTTNSCKNVVNTSGQPVTISKSALVATDSVTKLKTTKNNHSELTNSSIIDASSPASELIDSSSSRPAVKEENVPDDTIDEYMVKLEPEEEGQEHSDIVTAPGVSAPSRKKQDFDTDMEEAVEQSQIAGEECSDGEEVDPTSDGSFEEMNTDEADDHECSICAKTFANKYNLQRHVRIHSSDSVYCGKCSAEFETKDALLKHMSEKHPINHLICEDCGSPFPTTSRLQKHRIVKHKQEHKCRKVCPYTDCGKVFVNALKLEDHINTHLKRRPHRCDQPGCDKTFASRFLRNSHQKKCGDMGKSLHSCVECGKTFSSPQNVLIHKQSVHNNMEFVCFCGKSFKYITGLLKHKKNKKSTDICG